MDAKNQSQAQNQAPEQQASDQKAQAPEQQAQAPAMGPAALDFDVFPHHHGLFGFFPGYPYGHLVRPGRCILADDPELDPHRHMRQRQDKEGK